MRNSFVRSTRSRLASLRTVRAARSQPVRARFAGFGLALAALTLVTACQAIPTQGGVHAGLNDFSQAQEQVTYRPDMPIPDASQEEIVRGFLLAASSATDDYAIARQFLTENYRQQWNPYMGVLVDEGARGYSQNMPTQAKLSLTAVAQVADNGVMQAVSPEARTEVAFELMREGGQWRISSAPNGIILDRTTFKDIWVQHPLYFWGSAGTLVADSRWFLNRGQVTTQVVTELVAGPQELLAGSVTSAFVPGTTLASDTVIVEAGDAHIDVTSEMLNADGAALDRLKIQLGATLNSVVGVSDFVLSVDQAELISGPTVAAQNYQNATGGQAVQWPAVIKKGDFGFLSMGGFLPDDVIGERVLGLDPLGMINGGGLTDLVLLADDGVFYLTPNDTDLVDSRPNLLEPALDAFGYVWSMSAGDPQNVLITKVDQSAGAGQVAQLSIPWLLGTQVLGFKLSPDGAKIAFLVVEDQRQKVYISGVQRGEAQLPLQVIDAAESPAFWVNGQALDFDWVDLQRVAVLVKIEIGTPRITIGSLGGFTEDRPAMSGAQHIRGSSRISLMQVLDADGNLWSPQGNTGWQKAAGDVSLISKRG